MKLSTIAQAIGAKLHGPDKEISTVAIDSRKIEGGELFVALHGEKFDGHDFIEPAILHGAKAVLASKAPSTSLEKSTSFLQVADTTQALGQLAAYWRTCFDLPLVGVTGSCGKTTVKGLLESICQQAGKTLANRGNFNNHIGLPLTLLRLDASHRYGVIEMGASAVGEIRYLCEITKPKVTLITNVNPAHLQGFGSMENIAQAKGEIYEGLADDGIAILNIEEPFHKDWLPKIGKRKTITFGLSNAADVWADNIQLHPFKVECQLHYPAGVAHLIIPIPGMHMVLNALAASSAALALGISIEHITKGITEFQGTARRMRRVKGINGSCLIDDSYNANPGSMSAAVEVLASIPGERMFVMGDMAELGPNSEQYHAQIGQYAKEKGIERLLAVGRLSQYAVEAFGKGAKVYQDKESLISDVKNLLHSETVILVKGSRSAGMDVITDALTVGEE